MEEQLNEKKNVLAEAIADLDNKLNELTEEKKSLQNHLSAVENNIEKAHLLETRLRDKLSNIVAKEGRLSEKRKKLDDKLATIKERLIKIGKIKTELAEEELYEEEKTAEKPVTKPGFITKVKSKLNL